MTIPNQETSHAGRQSGTVVHGSLTFSACRPLLLDKRLLAYTADAETALGAARDGRWANVQYGAQMSRPIITA